MTFEIGEKKTKKQRAGFFENNIFVKPLTSRDEMRDFESDMPAEYKEKLLEYLASREHKLHKRNKNGAQLVEGSEAAYESANEAIGVEFKKPILSSTPTGKSESSQGTDAVNEQHVYDVREERMREIQGMVEVGKTVNLNQAPVEHEGLKRVLLHAKLSEEADDKGIQRKMKDAENSTAVHERFADIENAITKAKVSELGRPQTKEMECQTELDMNKLNQVVSRVSHGRSPSKIANGIGHSPRSPKAMQD